MMAKALAARMPPATPCRPRKAINCVIDWASPHSAEANMNSNNPPT
jgi:hypothetical protein